MPEDKILILVSNDAKKKLYEKSFHALLDFQDGEILIFGDMDGVFDPKIYRFAKSKAGQLYKNVANCMQMLNLEDLWTTLCPHSRKKELGE